MKRFIEGEDRQQVTLLPECLDNYVGGDNPVLDPRTQVRLKIKVGV